MKNQVFLLLLLGTLSALAQTPTPGISGAEYAGNIIRIGFNAQPNPFQALDSSRIEVVLVTQLSTSLLAATSLGDNADHPVISTWAAGAPTSIRVALKPTFRARYFVAACYSALTGGRRIRSPWSVLSTVANGPIALSAAPDSLEETPQAQVTILEDAGIGPGALVEASFSLFDRTSSNTEILVAAQGSVPLLIHNPESIASTPDRRLVVASSLAGAISQSNANTGTVLIRETQSGSPTLYRLFHHLHTLSVGDTVHFSLINPDGRELHGGPLFAHRPGSSFRMGRTLQALVCHPPSNTTDPFSGFSPAQSADSVAIGILAMAMLRTHVPHASRFAEDLDRESIYATGYLQAFDSCLTAWSSLQALTPGLPRLRVLQNHLLTLAAGRIEEPYSDAEHLAAPVLAYDAYTRFIPAFPLLTKPQGAVALFLSVSPNVSLHRLERMGMAVSLPEWVSATQATGLLLPTDSSTLNPVLRQGLYLRGKVSESGRKTTQYVAACPLP